MEQIILLCMISTALSAVHAQVNMHCCTEILDQFMNRLSNISLCFLQSFLYSPQWGPIGYKGTFYFESKFHYKRMYID